jgi:hypothetical protein
MKHKLRINEDTLNLANKIMDAYFRQEKLGGTDSYVTKAFVSPEDEGDFLIYEFKTIVGEINDNNK